MTWCFIKKASKRT